MLRSKPTRIGLLTLQVTEKSIARLFLPHEAQEAPEPEPGSLAEEAFRQLDGYLAGLRTGFQLPLAESPATAAQKAIVRAIQAIPYGCTATYGSLGPARFVGHVCAMNPLPLLIPCHRVVPAHRPPGLYRGGTTLKSWFLQLEQSVSLHAS